MNVKCWRCIYIIVFYILSPSLPLCLSLSRRETLTPKPRMILPLISIKEHYSTLAWVIAKALHCILHELTEIISVIIGLCVLNNKTNRVWFEWCTRQHAVKTKAKRIPCKFNTVNSNAAPHTYISIHNSRITETFQIPCEFP